MNVLKFLLFLFACYWGLSLFVLTIRLHIACKNISDCKEYLKAIMVNTHQNKMKNDSMIAAMDLMLDSNRKRARKENPTDGFDEYIKRLREEKENGQAD